MVIQKVPWQPRVDSHKAEVNGTATQQYETNAV